MKKITLNLFVLVAVMSVAVLSSCRFGVRGSGNVIVENRKVGDFTKLDVSGAYKIVLKQDSTLSLSISADDNLLKYIKTEVSGDKLRIYNKKNLRPRGDLTITIGVKSLNSVETSGAVEVSSHGKIIVQDLKFDLSGATKITMDLNAANVTTDGSGATRINLTGQASSHRVDLSGASKINALDFVVGDYTIETSGASKCEINVLNSLNIHSSGAAKVRYRGNPKTVNDDKSGASSVEKID